MGEIYLVSDKIQRTCVEINYGVIAIVNPSVECADLTLSFVANHRAGHTLNRFYIRGKINKWNVVGANGRAVWSFVRTSCTYFQIIVSTMRAIMLAEEVITKVISEKSLGQENSLYTFNEISITAKSFDRT